MKIWTNYFICVLFILYFFQIVNLDLKIWEKTLKLRKSCIGGFDNEKYNYIWYDITIKEEKPHL